MDGRRGKASWHINTPSGPPILFPLHLNDFVHSTPIDRYLGGSLHNLCDFE